MDTCIALRTMTFKNGVAYLQAGMTSTNLLILGGGIVYDSDPYEEYIETLNKLKANITTIQKAEELYARIQEGEKDILVDGEERQEIPEARIGKGI
jgi:anthranilate synthase component 1